MNEITSILKSHGVEEKTIAEWFKVRKLKKTANTESAITSVVKKILAAGMSVDTGIKLCVVHSWAGFDSGWIKSPAPQAASIQTIEQLYYATAGIYSHVTPSQLDCEIWQSAFNRYTVESVKQSVMLWRASSLTAHFMPTPANLLEILNPALKPLTADAAWAGAIAAQDEGATVVWTNRTQTAFLSAALPLLDLGDKVGARMAFKGMYDSLERMTHGDVYTLSIGKSKDGRRDVVSNAVIAGKITAHVAIAAGVELTDDALRHAANDNQLSWGDANKLRIGSKTVVNLLEQAPNNEQKKSAIEALRKYLAKPAKNG